MVFTDLPKSRGSSHGQPQRQGEGEAVPAWQGATLTSTWLPASGPKVPGMLIISQSRASPGGGPGQKAPSTAAGGNCRALLHIPCWPWLASHLYLHLRLLQRIRLVHGENKGDDCCPGCSESPRSSLRPVRQAAWTSCEHPLLMEDSPGEGGSSMVFSCCLSLPSRPEPSLCGFSAGDSGS